MNERDAARQLSETLDQLLQSPDRAGARTAWPADPGVDPATEQVIGRLAALPSLLPAPDAAFEQRVWRRVQAADHADARSRHPKRTWPAPLGQLRWAMVPLVALAVLVLAMLPGPRAAIGNWMARWRLGRVDLVLAPEPTPRPTLAADLQKFASVEEAEQAVGFHILAPGYLPQGLELTAVQTVSYEQLPAWMRPLFVETSYQTAADNPRQADARLRQYNARHAGGAQVGEIEFQSEDVRATRSITLAQGAPAVLLTFRQPDPPLRELIWEHDGMAFELWSAALSEDELIKVAESLR